MKTIFVTIALISLTWGANAKGNKACGCQKPMHHKVLKTEVGLKSTTPPEYTNRTHNVKAYPGNDVWQGEGVPIVNTPYAADQAVEYNLESNYTGNYPKPTLQYTKVDPRENANSRPNVSGLCLYDCSTK